MPLAFGRLWCGLSDCYLMALHSENYITGTTCTCTLSPFGLLVYGNSRKVQMSCERQNDWAGRRVRLRARSV